jgi:hypothetical protein
MATAVSLTDNRLIHKAIFMRPTAVHDRTVASTNMHWHSNSKFNYFHTGYFEKSPGEERVLSQ